MKLVIIPSDGAVYKDGYSYSELTLVGVPENVHALQWDSTAGWIEFLNESEFRKPPNESITELPQWALDALQNWEDANTVALQAAANMTAQPTVDGAQTL